MKRLADGRSVWVWPNAVPPATCAELLNDPAWKRCPIPPSELDGHTVNDLGIARELGKKVGAYTDLPIVAWQPIVTFNRSTRPIGPHVDASFGAYCKLFVYLNEPDVDTLSSLRGTPCGIRFGHRETLDVVCSRGTVVAFDIRLPHVGLPQPEGFLRQTLGFRPRLTAELEAELRAE